MTKKELKEALDKQGIEYKEDATNAELEALLPEEPKPEAPVEAPAEIPAVEPVPYDETTHPKYGKLTPFQWAYLKQNPAKFDIKWNLDQVPAEAPTSQMIKPVKR